MASGRDCPCDSASCRDSQTLSLGRKQNHTDSLCRKLFTKHNSLDKKQERERERERQKDRERERGEIERQRRREEREGRERGERNREREREKQQQHMISAFGEMSWVG